VTASGKTVSLVNTVGIENYIRGVVSSEMPKDWPLEAVKAQAVAARAYALGHRRGGAVAVCNATPGPGYRGGPAGTPPRRPGRRRHEAASAALRRQGRRHVLLLQLRWSYRRHQGRLHGCASDSLSRLGPRPLGHLLAVPQLGTGGGHRRGSEQSAEAHRR